MKSPKVLIGVARSGIVNQLMSCVLSIECHCTRNWEENIQGRKRPKFKKIKKNNLKKKMRTSKKE
jgi:hypothetical protein